MLAADKDRLIAQTKQTALQLRHKELEYYVERYSNLATQASIIAGFSFDGLVELDVDSCKDCHHAKWVESLFYASGSCAMAFALYTLCVASFATVYGHRLALQGPTGSVERAVAVMMKSRNSIFVSFAMAMLSLMVAASAMAWVKMGKAAAVVTGIFGSLFLVLLYKHQEMKHSFRIDPARMVRGDVRLQVGVTDVDIANLEAGFGGGSSGYDGYPRPADAHSHGLPPASNGASATIWGSSRVPDAGSGALPSSSATRREPLLPS